MSSSRFSISTSTRITHYWIPVLIMLVFQYTFSTGSFSSSETSRFIDPILRFIIRNPTPEQHLFWHHVIRKGAHVTEYCILGVLVYRAFRLDVSRTVIVSVLTMLFVAVAAMMDEFHQSFVPSRGSSMIDVGWDCIGGLISLTLSWIWSVPRDVEE